MIEVSLSNVHKYFGDKHVLKGISFEVTTGERVGLVGQNGAGKTTVFNAITTPHFIDDGFVKIYRGRTVGVLDQLPVYPDGYTVYNVLESGFHNVLDIKQEMRVLEVEMDGNNEVALKRYGELASRFEMLGGYSIESEIKKICSGLGIDEEMQAKDFGVLSGGEKTKINLARLMLTKPDILLLDEPTNHLDINTLEWFEDYLNNYDGTIIVISHDRYFLDKTVTAIVEIESGKAKRYVGNYTQYAAEREEWIEQEEARYLSEQRKIKQLQNAAARMHDWAQRADNPSMHRRAFSMEKRIEKLMESAAERPVTINVLKSQFKEESFASGEILIVEDLSKSFGDKKLFKNVTFTVNRGEYVALLGDNGTGKTTLLNIVNEQIQPDSGTARLGATVKKAYLEQNVIFDDVEATVLKTVMFELILNEEKARNLLAKFNFRGDDVFKQVKNLSGGERSRLRLCLLMQNDVSFLMLDEPTNHLDLYSREWIEEAVEQFGGTLLFVSHDRYFISRFAQRIIEIDDNEIIDFRGTYEEFIAWKVAHKSKQEPGNLITSKTTGEACDLSFAKKDESKELLAPEEAAEQEKKERLRRLSPNQLDGRIAKAEKTIAELEDEKDRLEDEMIAQAANYVILQELLDEASQIDVKIAEMYEEWELLLLIKNGKDG